MKVIPSKYFEIAKQYNKWFSSSKIGDPVIMIESLLKENKLNNSIKMVIRIINIAKSLRKENMGGAIKPN